MGSNPDDRTESSDRSTSETGLSRRQWLALSGSGLAAFAGCSGDGGSTATPTATPTEAGGTPDTAAGTPTPEPRGTPRDDELTGYQSSLPTDFNWNFFQSQYPAGNARRLYHEIRPQMQAFLEGWNYDAENKTERWTFPQGHKWWNGDDLTAEAEYMKAEIDRLQNPENSSVKSVSLVDDYTVEFTYKEQQNPTIVARQNALGTPICVKPSKYRQWLTRYQDASSQSQRDSITKELNNWTISTSQLIEEGIGNSPYELTKANSQEMVQELWDEHPWASNEQVEKWRVRTIAETPDVIIQQNKIDYGSGLPSDSYPANLKTIIERRSLQGSKVMFNNGSKHTKKRKVRRALIALLDGEFILRNQSPNAYPVTKNCGMGDVWGKQWLGKDLWNNLHEYPFRSKPKQAKKLLNEAGYSKQKGKWVDENGKTVTLTVLVGNWGAFVRGGRTVNNQLQQHGFDTDFQALTWSAFTDRAWNNMDHDVTFYYQNNWLNHPVSYYRPHYPGGMRLALPDAFREDIEGWLEEGRKTSPLTGIPLKPTIPSKPGALEVSGEGEQINLYKTWDAIHKAQSREETVANLRKLARYWNYDVPHFHVYQWRSAWWGDIEDFEFPIGSKEIKLYGSMEYAMKRGMIDYRFKD